MATMRAVRFHGQRDIRVDRIEVPVCGKDQIKVKPAFSGICGTDLHEWLGGPKLIPTKPHALTKECIPLTIGHEFSGTVEEVGENVTDVQVNDRVAIQPIIYDGDCSACVEGHANCCWNNGFIGMSGQGGGFSEHITVPRSAVIKLPDSVSLELGALVEPLAVGWHAVKLSEIKSHETALILGGGPIGLCILQALCARGCSQIIVTEISTKRTEHAYKFGATHVLNPTKDNITKKVQELTKNGGVHYVFDAAGVQAAVAPAVRCLRVRGTYVNVAVWEGEMVIMPSEWMFKERRWIGSATYDLGDFQEVIDAIAAGTLNPEPMITMKIDMDNIEEGFVTLSERKDEHVKILVVV